MGKTIRTRSAPKAFQFRLKINVPEGRTQSEIVDWCREELNGTIYWDAIGFSSSPYGGSNSRKVHFDDEKFILILWFSKKTDATIFALTWM